MSCEDEPAADDALNDKKRLSSSRFSEDMDMQHATRGAQHHVAAHGHKMWLSWRVQRFKGTRKGKRCQPVAPVRPARALAGLSSFCVCGTKQYGLEPSTQNFQNKSYAIRILHSGFIGRHSLTPATCSAVNSTRRPNRRRVSPGVNRHAGPAASSSAWRIQIGQTDTRNYKDTHTQTHAHTL